MLTLVALTKIGISYSPPIIGYATCNVIFVKSDLWKCLLLKKSKLLLEASPFTCCRDDDDDDDDDDNDDSMRALGLQE